MYRFVARLTPEDLESLAAQAYVEMLEAGFTRVGEFHYVHHDVDGKAYANPAEMGERIASAAALTGIGLTLLPVFYAHGGFGGAPSSDQQAVDRRWSLIHATHVTDSEVAGLAASGAVAGLCPITEANLGDGVFPAAVFQAKGGAYGVGSDSNVLISVSEELRLLEYGQRLRDHARNVMAGSAGRSTGRVLFDAVVQGGSRALAYGARAQSNAQSQAAQVPNDHVGLAVGAPADIISLSDEVALEGRAGDALLDTFVFASPRNLIDGVWRAGRKVVSGGIHLERAPIAACFRATHQRLLTA